MPEIYFWMGFQNFNTIEIIHKFYINNKKLNWKYFKNFIFFDVLDFKNKIFEYTNKYINSSLCFRIGIDCKNSLTCHQICLIITPYIKDKFILFEPNFRMYTFQSIESTVKANFDEKNIESYKFYINLLLLEH